MDAREFHRLAVSLAKQDDEAAQRTAVSRAYYAALNHAARLFERQGKELPDDYHIHQVVADSMADFMPGLKHELESLRISRGTADYRVWQTWDPREVEDALEVAEHIIATIDTKM